MVMHATPTALIDSHRHTDELKLRTIMIDLARMISQHLPCHLLQTVFT